MQFATLDIITRRSLLEKGLPIHYYLEYLVHGASAIRELSKDTLKIINAANLPLNTTYYTVDLPSDFVDDIAVCLPVDGLLQDIPKQPALSPLRIHDATTGAFVQNTTVETTDDQTFFGFPGAWNWYWNVNDYGEPTGRFFGAGGGSSAGYKVIKERRQIQFTGNVDGQSIVLLYISNGQSADNATQVDWLAFRAIQAYTNWMSSPNASIKDSPEGSTYYNEKRLLRSNLSDLTTTDIKNIVRGAYRATIKN